MNDTTAAKDTIEIDLNTIRLDEERPYGTCHKSDANEHTAEYIQDGLYFDAQGNLVIKMTTPAQIAELRQRVAAEQARKQAEASVRAALAEAGFDPNVTLELRKSSPQEAAIATASEINLLSWFKGAAKYPWPAVQAKLRQEFAYSATSKQGALQFLEDQPGFGKPLMQTRPAA